MCSLYTPVYYFHDLICDKLHRLDRPSHRSIHLIFLSTSQCLVNKHRLTFFYFGDNHHVWSLYTPVYYFHDLICDKLHRLDRPSHRSIHLIFLSTSQCLVNKHRLTFSTLVIIIMCAHCIHLCITFMI